MKRNPRHGTLFRRYLPSLDRYCYGVIRHETLLLIFDFLTPTTAVDMKHFSPSNIGGLLYVQKLEKRFEKCGRIDLDGSDASRWKAAIPVSHFILPEDFRKGPNGEDLFETYNYGDVKGIPKCVTREEITRFGIVPRRFLGSNLNDDDELLLNIVRQFRVLDEPAALAITGKPEEKTDEDAPAEVITVRFGVAIDQLSMDPETLADLRDEIEQTLFEAGQDGTGPDYESATVGQELDGELFWIVEIFASSEDAVHTTTASISKLIQNRLGGAYVSSEIVSVN